VTERMTGKMSTFGGPHDLGVGPNEGLACVELADLSDWWFRRCFLPFAPIGTEGLARRLNPAAYYFAFRFTLEGYSREQARRSIFKLTCGLRSNFAQCVDWGPAASTERNFDLSPALAGNLAVRTDDIIIVELLSLSPPAGGV